MRRLLIFMGLVIAVVYMNERSTIPSAPLVPMPKAAVISPAIAVPPAAIFMADPVGASVTQQMMLDDFTAYLGGGEVLGDYSKLVPPTTLIKAPQLWREYHANEIAADARFLKKPVFIEGRVKAIKRDAFGYAHIELDSEANRFMNVDARLVTDAENDAARLTWQDYPASMCRRDDDDRLANA